MDSKITSSKDIALTNKSNAKVPEGGSGNPSANRLETGWNAEKTAHAAKVINTVADGWRETSRPAQVLQALCDLAEKNPERLAPNSDGQAWGFLGMEIGDALRRFKIHGIDNWAADPDTARARMNTHWPKLEELWDRQQPTIFDGLNNAGLIGVPVLERVEGGGSGNSTRYGLRFDRNDGAGEAQPAPDINLLNVPQLRYRRKDIAGNRLVRRMSETGFFLGGWGEKVFTSAVIVLLAFYTFTLLIWFSGTLAVTTVLGLLKWTATAAAIVYLLYLFFGWFWRLLNNQVTLAPMILQPRSGDNYVLELRQEANKERKTMYLVRYVADCPICGEIGRDAVDVASGRVEFFGRLVGRCRQAPNAHVFSFDHISRQGRFLR